MMNRLTCTILALLSPACAAAAPPASQPAIPQAIAAALRHAIVDGDISRQGALIDQTYPGLRVAASAWAKRLDTPLPVDPTATTPPLPPRHHRVDAVVLPDKQPDLMRYLEFWSRADTSPRPQPGLFPVNLFDDLSSMTEDGRAYVILDDRKDYQVLWIHPSDPNNSWPGETFAPLIGAARAGAALALIQDYFTAVRDNRDYSNLLAAPAAKWQWPHPAKWMYLQQKFRGNGIGFLPLQTHLQKFDRQTAQLALWTLEADTGKNLGVNVHLITTSDMSSYLGWRIEKLEAVDAPTPEE